MTDAVGWRATVGVIIPSTNTVVEHDNNALRLPGVTFHAGRMWIENPVLSSDAEFQELLVQIRASIGTAVRDVMTCRPDHLLMGMSAETFWGGVAGNAAFEERIHDLSGLRVTTGASSCRAALELFGARSIAFLTPYQPIADRQVAEFFTEAGFSVKRHHGLRCPSATDIARVTPERVREVLLSLDGDDVDAIVQVGTNLSAVAVADRLEAELGKPVISINTAVLWKTLRTLGITDRVAGHGRLLREH
jgi:maleate isomerase